MSLMISGLYDALIAAGSPEDKARQAATEVASYDNQIAEIKGDVKVLKAMLGAVTALCVSILFLVIKIYIDLP